MSDKANAYQDQRRGDHGAYERYLKGMDASMRQKVALTAAYLLAQGRIADMGMGSGSGSYALAALYPAIDVVGVDIDPTTVALARERHQLPNLSFEAGDIALPVFDPGTLDGIMNSSVLHHVTSFNDYDDAKAGEAIRVQAPALREHGVMIVRDFINPGEEDVLLDLPTNDGDDSEDPMTCSTAALFKVFACQYRSLSESPGFEYEELEAADSVDSLPAGWKRFKLSHRLAAEFVLRKDYRQDWEQEVKEAYTYFTQAEFENLYACLGLRVLVSTPLRNHWIIRNRFRNKIQLADSDGNPLEFPPTNYLIVGESVPHGQGVVLSEGESKPPQGFLTMAHFRDRRNGQVMDLVQRPHRTLDILPWFEASGDIFVLARGSYPRPILCCKAIQDQSLDGAHSAGYVSEPLAVIQTDKPVGQTVEEILEKGAGVKPEQIKEFRKGSKYYPSPGGVQEEVRSALVEIEPAFVHHPLENMSGFTTSGRVQVIEIMQLLRAAQVGGLPDARLEMNAYELLLQLEKSPGPWIGESIALEQGEKPENILDPDTAGRRPSRRVFQKVDASQSTGFLDLQCSMFEERDWNGKVICEAEREYVIPATLSRSTIATAVLRKHAGEIYLGIDDHDLPAAQSFNGNSEILVTPAWRIPKNRTTMTSSIQWVMENLEREYGLECGETWALGGSYHPSLGVTPEVVHPMAVEVKRESVGEMSLMWVPLVKVLEQRASLYDGHLRIVALRAAHALGLMEG